MLSGSNTQTDEALSQTDEALSQTDEALAQTDEALTQTDEELAQTDKLHICLTAFYDDPMISDKFLFIHNNGIISNDDIYKFISKIDEPSCTRIIITIIDFDLKKDINFINTCENYLPRKYNIIKSYAQSNGRYLCTFTKQSF